MPKPRMAAAIRDKPWRSVLDASTAGGFQARCARVRSRAAGSSCWRAADASAAKHRQALWDAYSQIELDGAGLTNVRYAAIATKFRTAPE